MKEKPLHPFVIYIKRLLNERGISYADLSEMTGVSLGTIKHVMCGNQCMTLSVRDSLCHALNVTPLDAFLYELPDIVKNLPRSQKTVTLTILRDGETLTKELERL